MEIEMKYSIGSKENADLIWEDASLLSIADLDSRETVYMKAAYFDTDDNILSKNDIAFRIRMEGSRIVASLKWNGGSDEGLHTREEINVPVDDEICFISPDPSVFRESDQGKDMMGLLKQRPLHNVLETRFLRRKMKIDTGKCICELAIDIGEIVTDYGNEPICELELELYSGDQASMTAIGAEIAEKYQLQVENRTKYARGLTLLNIGAGVR